MPTRTSRNNQQVVGNTIVSDSVSTLASDITAGNSSGIIIVDATDFPDTGTVTFLNAASTTFTYNNRNASNGSLTGAIQALPSIDAGVGVEIVGGVTLTSPFYPSADGSHTDEWEFSASTPTANNPQGAINFRSGASTVWGSPLLRSGNLSSSMTNTNAPYIFGSVAPVWDSKTAYAEGSQVLYDGREYTVQSGQSVSAGSDATTTFAFNGTAPTGAGLGPSRTATISGYTAGDLGDNSHANDTAIALIFENGTPNGLATGSTRTDIFGGGSGSTKVEWLDALVNSANTSGDNQFGGGNADDLSFTFSRVNNTIVMSAKEGETLPTSGLSASSGINVDTPVITYQAETNNTTPDSDTTVWQDDGDVGDEWRVNPQSIVETDENGRVTILERVTIRLTGDFDADDGGGANYTLFQSNNSNCAPVFYGVDFIQEGNEANQSFMNICGQDNGSFNVFDDAAAAPQFHDCTFTVRGTSNFRWGSTNYLINGMTYLTFGSGAFEFPVVPSFTPQGLNVSTPRFLDQRDRANLVFCDSVDTEANRSSQTYTFEGATFTNFPCYNGFDTANASKENGYVLINPVGSPPIPYSTTTAFPPTTGFLQKPMVLGTRTKRPQFADKLNTNSQLMVQRVIVSFPSTGWTVRVIKTNTNTYLQDGSESRTVEWQGVDRVSNGVLRESATNTWDTGTEYFPTAAQVLLPETEDDATGRRNLRVLETSSERGSLRTNDIPVYYGYDEVANGDSVDLILPGYINQAAVGTPGAFDTEMIFFDYKLILQHDEYGTVVRYLSYDPASDGTDNSVEGYYPASWNVIGDELIPVTVLRDVAFVQTASDYTANITNIQELYDALKTYERQRSSTSGYDSSHRTSDLNYLSRTGKSFTTIDTNLVSTSTGNSIQSNGVNGAAGTTMSVKTSGFTAGDLSRVDTVVMSGNIDYDTFPSFVGATFSSATATNLPSTLDGTITTTSASTSSDTLIIAPTGHLDGAGWTLSALTSNAGVLPADTGGQTTGVITSSGLLTLAGTHNGNITATGTGTLAHSVSGRIDGTLTSSSDGVLSVGSTGTVTGDITHSNGAVNIAGIVVKVDAGDGDSTFSGTATDKVTLGDGDSTVSGDITVSSGDAIEIGNGDNSISGTIIGDINLGNGDNTIAGSVTGDIVAGTTPVGLTLDGTITGDLTTGTGHIVTGFNFSMNGTMTPGEGSVTFKASNNIDNLALVADGVEVTIVGKLLGEFAITPSAINGGTFIFPSFAPTRVDVKLGSLNGGTPYDLYLDETLISSGTTTAGSTGNLRFSDTAGDAGRTVITDIAGHWTLGIVDDDKPCVFTGITVVSSTDATNAAEHELIIPPFVTEFNVGQQAIGSRTATVSDTDVYPLINKTNSGIRLEENFPQSGNVFEFISIADAQAFMVLLGLNPTPGLGVQQTYTGSEILSTGGSDERFELSGTAWAINLNQVGEQTLAFDGMTMSLGEALIFSDSISTIPQTEITISGCTKNDFATQGQSSRLIANARKSVNYITSMRARIKRGVGVLSSIPANGNFMKEDVIQPVIDGANLRNGTYSLTDNEDGVQLLDGMRDTLNVSNFAITDSNGVIKTERQLRLLNSDTENDGETQRVRTSSRQIVSAQEIGAVTVTQLRPWANNLTTNVKTSDFTSQIATDPTLL